MNRLRQDFARYLRTLDSLKDERFGIYFSGSTKYELQTTTQTIKISLSLEFKKNGRFYDNYNEKGCFEDV